MDCRSGNNQLENQNENRNENLNQTANKILIITGGYIDIEFMKSHMETASYDIIIAADHGLSAADQLNLKLDYIVGDFDSVPESILSKYREKSIPINKFPREKDMTDTQIALELALKQHPKQIVLIGATGSRMDHSLGNLHLLMLPMLRNVDAFILDSNNKIYLKMNNFIIKKNEQFGQYVSLLPFSEKVCGLTLQGFKYSVDNMTITFGTSMGISNEIVDVEAKVAIKEGILVVIEARD